MEKMEKAHSLQESIRSRNIGELIDCIVYRGDAELSYYCTLVLDNQLGALSKAKLVGVIASDGGHHGSEFAFRLLRDQRHLDHELRDLLLNRIVDSADKTTCSQVLLSVPRLGVWEGRLRDVLAN